MTSDRLLYSQAGRMMAVETRLGTDELLLERLEIDESINALFLIRAMVKAQRDDLQADDLIGSTVDFRLRRTDGETRWWNGFATELEEGSLTTRATSFLRDRRETKALAAVAAFGLSDLSRPDDAASNRNLAGRARHYRLYPPRHR